MTARASALFAEVERDPEVWGCLITGAGDVPVKRLLNAGDAAKGVRAFKERRPPRFQGRQDASVLPRSIHFRQRRPR